MNFGDFVLLYALVVGLWIVVRLTLDAWRTGWFLMKFGDVARELPGLLWSSLGAVLIGGIALKVSP
jgi:hypothetical protein